MKFFLGLVGLLCLSQAHGGDCVRLGLAQRTGRESCWARYPLGDHRTICVDHRNWVRWLLSPAPAQICLGPTQPWKASSPLINEPKFFDRSISRLDSVRPSGFPTGSEKITVFRQNYLSSGSSPPGPRTLSLLIIQKIELIRERTSSQLAEHDAFGILRSLLVNEKTPQSPVSLLRKIGFVHLASATGIHLYALARGWDALLRISFFYLRLPTVVGIWSSRILSFGLCFCVWILSGARVGMLRPWIVLSLREVSTLLGFRWRRAAPLLVALTLDFGIACFWTWTVGESFGPSGRMIYALAVGGGLIWCRSFKSLHLGLAIGSWLLVAVWEAWHTGTVALFTPLLSLISLPLVCFFIFPAMIASIFTGEWGFTHSSEFVVRELSWGFSIFMKELARFAFSFGNLWVVSQTTLLWAFFLASLICVFQSHRSWRAATYLGIIGVLLGLRFFLEFIPINPGMIVGLFDGRKEGRMAEFSRASGNARVEQLDVGQGDSALVQERRTGFAGLIDAGSENALSDEGWLQLFAQRQITRLNWAAISHLDEDHSGGFLRLARLLPIDCITTPWAQQESRHGQKYAKSLSAFTLHLERWNSGCIPYPTYTTPNRLPGVAALGPNATPNFSRRLASASKRPPKASRAKTRPIKRRPNEDMGAVYVPLEGGGFYLSAGDATQHDEIFIGKWAAGLGTFSKPGIEIPQRVLKISHHGSKTSSAPEFLKLVRPTEVWISAGRGNRYGHPAPVVLKRLQDLNIPTQRTDRTGVLSTF